MGSSSSISWIHWKTREDEPGQQKGRSTYRQISVCNCARSGQHLSRTSGAQIKSKCHLLQLLFAGVDVERPHNSADLAHVAGLAALSVKNGKGWSRREKAELVMGWKDGLRGEKNLGGFVLINLSAFARRPCWREKEGGGEGVGGRCLFERSDGRLVKQGWRWC